MRRLVRRWRLLVIVLPALALGTGGCRPGETPNVAAGAAASGRSIVVISDLHLGVGKIENSDAWDPTEDFRWSHALSGFLDYLNSWGNGQVDLVIAGDLLELWQPRAGEACRSADAAYGCTPPEMGAIARVVVRAHRQDLAALGTFARLGQNRLFVVPGNHDAALGLPEVWQPVAAALGASGDGRVVLVSSGVWASSDGAVVVEHGHQIGADVNRYEGWPAITARRGSLDHVLRPWGERFVQKLFNEREQQYPVIDNLVPEAAGARHYMAARGLGGSAVDLARFLAFNLVETSLAQKAQALGGGAPGAPPVWSIQRARGLGHKLFAGALPANDPFRRQLIDDPGPGWEQLRASLASLARDANALPDDEVKALCDQIAIRRARAGGAAVDSCEDATLGALVESLLVPRNWIMRSHLQERLTTYPAMRVFIYGHTHALEFDWTVSLLGGLRAMEVANSGAFQRLMDDERFVAEAQRQGKSPADALRDFRLDRDFPACYSAVLVTYSGTHPRPQVRNWHSEESRAGQLVGPCDRRCAKISNRCPVNGGR